MSMSPVTQRIYEVICEYLEDDIHPTYREIAERCNMAHTGVIRHIDKLEGLGWIVREEAKMRSIRLGPKAPPPKPHSQKEKRRS